MIDLRIHSFSVQSKRLDSKSPLPIANHYFCMPNEVVYFPHNLELWPANRNKFNGGKSLVEISISRHLVDVICNDTIIKFQWSFLHENETYCIQ